MYTYRVRQEDSSVTEFYLKGAGIRALLRKVYGPNNLVHIMSVAPTEPKIEELVAQFEEESGEKFDSRGQLPGPCSECGKLMQYYWHRGRGHTCPGIETESRAAARDEERAHGRD